jgi:hypothetical protein
LIKPNSIIISKALEITFGFAVLSCAIKGAVAAPCCAGNAAAPLIISGDEQAQLSVLVSHSSVIGDVEGEGEPVFWNGDQHLITQTVRVDGAILLSDRWQVGAMIPLVQEDVQTSGVGNSGTSLGDVRLNGAYEFLPEWSYSSWKPKGYLFSQLILPTGNSVYDSTDLGMVDAAGNGFYTIAFGSLLVKRWSSWDASFIPEIHYGFSRNFSDEGITVGPGIGASALMGGGWSRGAFRVGGRVQPQYSAPKQTTTDTGQGMSVYQFAWNTGADFTYMPSDELSVTASYTDQTLLGPAVNTQLSRTFALMVQRRWDR